jgi:flagellar hook assembly protein FlgD
MKGIFLFLLLLLLSIGSTYAQSDSLFIDNGTIVKKYLLSQIDSITFFVPITAIKGEGSDQVLLAKFSVTQNYPNPFNPSTKIQFQLPGAGKVRLTVYDINGRLIKEIFSGNKQAGQYTFEWNGQNSNGVKVSTGVYFYSVEYNSTLLTKKMIYLK